MAWQRTYRPRTIADLHLTKVREVFLQMMADGRFPQVLLFAGPKGTGKTSAARIIGALLNDEKNAPVVDALFFGKKKPSDLTLKEPDTDTDFAKRVYEGGSFVVQEMDAASYRGIDDVRALKERVMLPPQEGKIAVYILDEVHMFTTEAFNALLKLLEEPPAHAVFILATTELHKIPETIISRSTKVDFRKATTQELATAITNVLKKESVEYEDEAVARLAELADGSFRDGVKLAELVAQSGTVTLKAVEAATGENLQQLAENLAMAVVAKETDGVLSVLRELRERGVQEAYFYKRFFALLHDSVMQDLGVMEGKPLIAERAARFLLTALLKADLQQSSPIAFLPLELALLDIVERAKAQNAPGSSSPAKKKIVKVAEPVSEPAEDEIEVVASVGPIDAVDSASVTPTPSIHNFSGSDQDLQEMGKSLMEQWEKFLAVVQQRNATVAALLRSGRPAIGADGVPQVGVFYKFHQEQLLQRKYMTLMQDCAKDVIGMSLPIQVSLEQVPQTATLVEVEATANLADLAAETLIDGPKV